MYMEAEWASTKEGVAIRGNISGELLLVDKPHRYLSTDEFREKGKEVLRQSFKSAVGKMSAEKLQNTLLIEVGVGSAELNEVGLKWKPGSVIEVSHIHGAPPGS